MNKELITGIMGTGLGAVGTAIQPNDILQTISLIITILGGIVCFIVVPLLNWFTNAKKDGKVTIDEIKTGAETLKDGLDKTKDQIDRERKGNGKNEQGKN